MNIIELINNLFMAGIIGVMAIIFANLVIRAIGEESRKNTDYAMKAIDKLFDKIPKIMTETFDSITKMEQKEKEEIDKYNKNLDDYFKNEHEI